MYFLVAYYGLKTLGIFLQYRVDADTKNRMADWQDLEPKIKERFSEIRTK